MELGGRRYRIRLRIILAALVFSSVIFLSGCGGGGGNGGGGNNPPPASTCNKNSAGVYNCNVNITIKNTAGYGQSGGVSVTVANPQ